MNPIISVIIPNYNSQIIGDTINALIHQTYDNSLFEIIIVGTDSFDLIKPNKLVRFDRSDRKLSPAQARNRGAKLSRGSILIFLDADCIPYPNWIEIIADRFSNNNIQVLGGGVDFEENNFWTLSDNISMFYEYYYKNPPGYRNILPSLNFAIRKDVFNKLGGYDEKYTVGTTGEDADLTLRLKKMGYSLYFEPRAVVRHKPDRNNLIALLKHSFYQGKYSTKIDNRYYKDGGLPWPFRTRIGIIIFAPFIGYSVAFRIFIKYHNLLRYWYTFPAIYLAKLSWCIGAANHQKFYE